MTGVYDLDIEEAGQCHGLIDEDVMEWLPYPALPALQVVNGQARPRSGVGWGPVFGASRCR